MAILGPIIKAALNIHEYFTHVTDHHEAQQKVLKHLLETAAATEFGKEYDFKGILKDDNLHEAFDNAVPFHDYNNMNEKWSIFTKHLLEIIFKELSETENQFKISSNTLTIKTKLRKN